MKLHWRALLVVLTLCVLSPLTVVAQGTSTPGGSGGGGGGGNGGKLPELGQNYPNPVVTDTKIPFTVAGGPTCEDPSRLYKVSVKIYNILSQFVAVPVLQPGGEPAENVMVTCNQYVAYWDAKYSKTGQRVPPGIYLYRLEIDGRAVTKKLIVAQ